MQQEWWMRPALQRNEAVLLPALERNSRPSLHLLGQLNRTPRPSEHFVPISEEWPVQTTALSTYVRPRGSMAGRGVLRAAGIQLGPCRYAAGRTGRTGLRSMCSR